MKKNEKDAMILYVFDNTYIVKEHVSSMLEFLNRAYDILRNCIKNDRDLTDDEIKELNNLYCTCMELNEIVGVELASCQNSNVID